MNQQFVVNRTIHQTEIPAFLDNWAQTHFLSKSRIYKKKKKNASLHIFLKTICVKMFVY